MRCCDISCHISCLTHLTHVYAWCRGISSRISCPSVLSSPISCRAISWRSVLSFVPVILSSSLLFSCVTGCCNVVHWAVVRCSALQYIAVCCNTVQCGAARCSALQCVAVRCSALQCVANRSSTLPWHEVEGCPKSDTSFESVVLFLLWVWSLFWWFCFCLFKGCVVRFVSGNSLLV